MRTAVDRRGISLLEAVVGLAMVGMTAAGALSAAGAGLRATERARRAIEASVLATQRLNALNLLTNNELLSLPDSVTRGRFAPPFEDYRWATEVGVREKEQGVYDVVLRVTWSGGGYTIASALYRTPPVMTVR
jgi:type II secretory pathway pseudopilin PulG